MSDFQYISPSNAQALCADVLIQNGTSIENAKSTATALVHAERDGQIGHGLARLPFYAKQVKSGKINGHAKASIKKQTVSAACIDAQYGFAYPACDLSIKTLINKCQNTPIALATIYHSHHFGQAGFHVERLAEKGLVGLMFGNCPKAIAPWGGSEPIFGTNPIAFATPRKDADPMVIDMSLSKVARGKIMRADQLNESIPEGWALDKKGKPTASPAAALAGSMLPIGDVKGSALALMVEILSAALSGGHFSYEASSFFEAEGDAPNVGQTILAIDPNYFSNDTFLTRIEQLFTAINGQDSARLPGMGRFEHRITSDKNGLKIPQVLMHQIEQCHADAYI